MKKSCPWPFMHPMLMMIAHTGARRSELLRSQRTDFNFDTVIIHEKKRAKGRYTTRTIPMSKKLKTVMHEWLSLHEDQPTFGNLTVDQTNHYFRCTMTGKWSNIRGWHTFRHSFASNCAAVGVDQRMINTWMGHQTEEMRNRYRHLFPEDGANAISVLSFDAEPKPRLRVV